MYTGAYLHTDDNYMHPFYHPFVIYMEGQIQAVDDFTKDNFLKLNASKCEVIKE